MPATNQQSPKMEFKIWVKNEKGVIKVNAKQNYEDALELAVKNKKMTEDRRIELLAKI